LRTDDVDSSELVSVIPRLTDVRQCRKVIRHVGVKPLENLSHAEFVSDVTFAVDAVDFVTAVAKITNEVMRDEAVRSGNESPH
jgi:hypothetical protein